MRGLAKHHHYTVFGINTQILNQLLQFYRHLQERHTKLSLGQVMLFCFLIHNPPSTTDIQNDVGAASHGSHFVPWQEIISKNTLVFLAIEPRRLMPIFLVESQKPIITLEIFAFLKWINLWILLVGIHEFPALFQSEKLPT